METKQFWNGNADMQAEANERGNIIGSFTINHPQWRDYCEEFWFSLHELNDNGDTWDVSAVITKSENKRFLKGDIVTFELYKDTDIFNLSTIIKEQFLQEF